MALSLSISERRWVFNLLGKCVCVCVLSVYCLLTFYAIFVIEYNRFDGFCYKKKRGNVTLVISF